MTKPKKKKTPTHFTLPLDLAEELVERAKASEIQAAAVVRTLLRWALKHYPVRIEK